MAKIEFKLDTKKFQRELNKHIQKIAKEEALKASMEYPANVSEMRMLDKMTEEALKIILSQYDGNTDYCVSGNYDLFPVYMKFSLEDIFLKLKYANLIASNISTLSGWSVFLTPNGITYFEDKKEYLKRNEYMFKKLPNNSKQLLKEILEAADPAQMLADKFENCNEKEDEELRSIMRELSDYGLIETEWADNVPYYITINNSARTYFEREKEHEENLRKSSGTTVNIGTFTATGSNVILGDAINSSLTVDNSIQRIEKRIEDDGGEDKETLKGLLDEAKELIENIQATRQIPKNKGFFNRLSLHLEKHGWFYGEIVGLLGNAVLKIIQG